MKKKPTLAKVDEDNEKAAKRGRKIMEYKRVG